MLKLFNSPKFPRLFLAGYGLAYLLTRLVNLTLLPAHYDELAQLKRLEEFMGGNLLVGLSDNLKWLQLWLLAAFSWLPAGPLWNGRFPSILLGLAGGIGVYRLALALYQRLPVAVLASLFYFLVPFVFFYDRMVMPDGLLATLGIWTMIFSLEAVRQGRLDWALAAGLAICLASLTKLSGLAYLAVPLAAFLLFKPSPLTPKSWKVLGAMYVPALAGAVILGLFLNRQNLLVYTTKISGQPQTDYWQLWLANSRLATDWVAKLMTYPLLGLGLLGVALTFLSRSRAGLYLLVTPLAMALPFIAISEDWYPRYLLPVAPSLLILGAWALDRLYHSLSHFPPLVRWRGPLFAGLGLLLITPALLLDFWLLVDPAQAPLPAEERRQYIEGWPTTYGLAEAAAYVETLAGQRREIYLVVNTNSFIVKEGLRYYFNRPTNVKLRELDPSSGHALQDLNAWALERPTFLIVNPAREKELDDFWTNPQLFIQVEKVAGFPKPGGKTSIDIYQWRSIPAMAEQWALWSGIEQPVIMSDFTQVADATGAAHFEPLRDTGIGADFVLIEAKTLASGAFVQNGSHWMAQLPPDWALTQFVPGNWYLFRLTHQAPPQHPLQATLGEAITLTGFDLLPSPDPPGVGQPLHLILHWQALDPIPEDYVVFAQLIGPDGLLYAQQDRSPLLPTTRWLPGHPLADAYTIPLDQELPPGPYRLITGLYHPTSGQRLPAYRSDGQRWPDDAIVLTEVRLN
jgi:hypothetical protein